MTVPRKMTTHNTQERKKSRRSNSWVQYINLDREVLNPSPCEQHMDTDVNSLTYETVREVQPNILDVHQGSSSDNATVRKVDFLTVKYREWHLHLECPVRNPVLKVRSRHEQLPPHRRFKAVVCEHTRNHGVQSLPHASGHTDLLRRVGGGERLDNSGLQVLLSNLLPDVLAALGGKPTSDAADEGDDHRADEQPKRLKILVLVGQQVDGGPLRVLVGYLADVLVAAYGHWREGPYQIPLVQLERLCMKMTQRPVQHLDIGD